VGLGVNLPGLVAWIVSFLLFMVLLKLVLYGPITRMLDERSRRIQESLDQADRVKAESSQAEEQVKRQLDAAREEGRNIVAQAQQVANRLREEELVRVRAEVEQARERAQADIQRERDAAIEELRRSFADLTILAAERVINTSLDRDQHRRLIQEVMDQSRNIGRN